MSIRLLLFVLAFFAAFAVHGADPLYCCDQFSYSKNGKLVHGYLAYADLGRVNAVLPTTQENCTDPFPDTLVTVEDAAVRAGAELAVNANFFATNGDWHAIPCTKTIGVAVSEGEVLSGAGDLINGRQLPDTLLVLVSGTSTSTQFVLQPQAGYVIPKETRLAVSGVVIVQNGTNVSSRAAGAGIEYDKPAPRTAIGILADGRTALIVMVEGRLPGISDGIDLSDLADQMLLRGVRNGMTLDGGGSSTLISRPGPSSPSSVPVWSKTAEKWPPSDPLMQYRPVPVTLAFRSSEPCVDANQWWGSTFVPNTTTFSEGQTQSLTGRFDVRYSFLDVVAAKEVVVNSGTLVEINGSSRAGTFSMRIADVAPCTSQR